jgi:hypothetical protein
MSPWWFAREDAVEADPGIGVAATTVGELRKVTVWPENLVVA